MLNIEGHKMTDEEINKKLHKIMELCYHEREDTTQLGLGTKCKHCPRFLSPNSSINEYRVNFFLWGGFGILWEFILKHNSAIFWEWLFDKWADQYSGIDYTTTNFWIDIVGLDNNKGIIYPPVFAKLVVEFFEETK